MNLQIYLTLILFLVTKLTICNETPVIGILAQEIYWSDLRKIMPSNNTYIAASYVKAIEASGGRVVPVFTNRTLKYYADMVRKLNGILVPGGGCAFDIKSGIGQSTYEIFKIAKFVNKIHLIKIHLRINSAGDHFPILGICLGFELLLMASIDGKFPFINCHAANLNLPLKLIPEMDGRSILFREMPANIRNILLTQPVTANHHVKCMTKQNFTSMNLNKFWNPITINKDNNNLTFISIIEAKKYPFIGLQFHPEKNAWEFEKNDPHSSSAVYSARYFYDWFVNECRKNNHSYIDKNILESELIYNYPAAYVGKFKFSVFEQVYVFNE